MRSGMREGRRRKQSEHSVICIYSLGTWMGEKRMTERKKERERERSMRMEI